MTTEKVVQYQIHCPKCYESYEWGELTLNEPVDELLKSASLAAPPCPCCNYYPGTIRYMSDPVLVLTDDDLPF